MAIKVKHEGSAASRMAASAAGGAAKRAMEAAALAKPSQIQTLQPAHASAPGISAPHAPLISAPGGGAHAPLIGGGGGIGATARHGSAGGGRGSGSRVATSGAGADGDYKVTGTSIFDRPDDESVWNDQTRQWMRKWLPGEKEAEALQRVGDVKNAQHREILDYQHNLAKDRAEQSSLLTTERDIKSALLKVPPKGTPPAVLAPFATDPNASGDQPELFNRLKEINPKLLNLRDGLNGEEQQKPFDNAMAMALKVISGAGTSMDADPMSPGAPSGSGKLGMMFDSLSAQRGRGAPAAQPTSADDISGVYESGGSIFGGQGDAPAPSPSVSWLRSPDAEIAAGGGDAVASEAYASSVGGMIDAFMRRNYNV